MRSRISLFAVAVLVVSAAADEKVDTAKVEEQARAVGKAFLDGDWAKVADLTHPRIVELTGGREKMIQLVDNGMKQLKAQGFSFKSYKVGTAEAPVTSGKTAYVVVPTSLEIAGPGNRLVTDSYLLGISGDGGKTWTFADGAGLSDPEKRKAAFPDLPKDLKLPEKKPPQVIKE